MAILRSLLGLLAVAAPLVSAATDDGDKTEMGPAAFMWPKDRVWSGDLDNTAPCGSSAKAGDRSTYPLKGAKIALVAQDESYDVHLSIAYMDEPTKDEDFTELIDGDDFQEALRGHTCIPVPDVRSSAKAGDKATLQVKYIADFDKPYNQTFYACADVTLVEISNFKEAVPCFNATKMAGETDETSGDEFGHGKDSGIVVPSSTGSSSGASATGGASSSDNKAKGGSDGLSKGAIAGIVVGSIAGAAIIAGLAFLWYRQSNRKIAVIRQATTSRGVNWEMQPPKDSQSGTSSVRGQNAA